ncbi:sensor histidine kinase, partial [Paraburkholderia fungorum]|uniref:sensor histidine kinase n=1 Tax=Paraburkholderia fungorum TaxID=134537 RepID=UPI0021A320D9
AWLPHARQVFASPGLRPHLTQQSTHSRFERGQQKVEVRDIVPRVIDAMQGSIRARRAHVIVDELPPVWGDPTALEQVFANLIGNAVNYLDPSREGLIEIGTTPAPPGVHSLRIFYVRDNGLGIPAVALPRLFNAFQRLHGNVAAGEGIGLALVRRVVERHGGRVWAESKEGVGTTFYLSLPEAGTRSAQRSFETHATLADGAHAVQGGREARAAAGDSEGAGPGGGAVHAANAAHAAPGISTR